MRSPETRLASSLPLSGPFHNSDNPRWTNYLSRIFDAPVFEIGLFSHSSRHSRGLYSDYATVRTRTISPASFASRHWPLAVAINSMWLLRTGVNRRDIRSGSGNLPDSHFWPDSPILFIRNNSSSETRGILCETEEFEVGPNHRNAISGQETRN